MIALIQRVKEANVTINNSITGSIGNGLLILLGIEKEDNEEKADKLCERVLNYRIFADKNNKMCYSVKQIGGSVLIVSQFTLLAETKKGLRPSFSKAASPEKAIALYNRFIENCKKML